MHTYTSTRTAVSHSLQLKAISLTSRHRLQIHVFTSYIRSDYRALMFKANSHGEGVTGFVF